jgi:hypothetical protein
MRLNRVIKLLSLVLLLFSCNNKKADKNIILENNYFQDFSQNNTIEMIYPIEYYKNEINKYQDNYYGGFSNISMEMSDLMNISLIIEVHNFIPDLLTFFVCWYNQKGYVYILYSFDYEQNIIKHYYCGEFNTFENYRILMKKLSGNILDYGAISIGDFNNDGYNEIALYSFYKNIGDVFCVYEFNSVENELEKSCLVPVFINYYTPFPSVEYIGNGFRVLEVVDDDPLELAWNNYIWDTEKRKYIENIMKQ